MGACLVACLILAGSVVVGGQEDLSYQQRKTRAVLAQAMLVFTGVDELGEDGVKAELVGLMGDSAGEELVTKERKVGLAARMAEQVVVRSQGVEAYMEFVDGSEPRWITAEEDDEWYPIESNLQGTISPEAGDRSDPRGCLETIARRRLEDDRNRIKEWCADVAGTAVVFYEAEDSESMMLGGYELHEKKLKDMVYIGGGSSAMRAWWPAVTGKELLARDGAVVCADAMLMVRWGDGTTTALMMVWALDAESGEWVCEKLGEFGIATHLLCY